MRRLLQTWLTSFRSGLTENSFPALRRWERAKAIGWLIAIVPTLAVAVAKEAFGGPTIVWDLLFSVAIVWFVVVFGLMLFVVTKTLIRMFRAPKRDVR